MRELIGLPVLASKHGYDVDRLIYYVHYLMIALFIGWLVYFVYAVWRFRASRHPKANHMGVTNHSSNYVEGCVIVAEAVLLLGFAIPWWTRAVERFPSERESTVLRVVAEQFFWNARYPGPDGVFGAQNLKFRSSANKFGADPDDPKGKDDILVSASMVVPLGKPVIIHLSSIDVIHSFKVPPLRVCQDATPGLSVPFHFEPTRTGNYQITCAQLCGLGHYSMRGEFSVVTPEEYDEWLKSKSAAPAAVDYE